MHTYPTIYSVEQIMANPNLAETTNEGSLNFAEAVAHPSIEVDLVQDQLENSCQNSISTNLSVTTGDTVNAECPSTAPLTPLQALEIVERLITPEQMTA